MSLKEMIRDTLAPGASMVCPSEEKMSFHSFFSKISVANFIHVCKKSNELSELRGKVHFAKVSTGPKIKWTHGRLWVKIPKMLFRR